MKMAPVPPSTSSSPMHPHQQFRVTEDTPVDYLEGCMEVLVVFPNEKCIPMSIQRRMPMLDLLIHVTAANKIPPSSHVLHVTDQEGRSLTHKPSTPIGSLNAHTVYIVPKNRLGGDRSSFTDGPTRLRSGNIPLSKSSSSHQFEPSFRLQVRLPRSQLFVTRVTGRTLLGDLLRTVCDEKDLDPRHYELRHPVNLDERLRLSSCLDDYKLTEVVVVATTGTNGHRSSTQDLPTMNSNKGGKVGASGSSNNNMPAPDNKTAMRMTASDAALHPVHQDKKKRGLFGIFNFGKSKKGSSLGDSSISSDSVGDRSISPSRSDEAGPAQLPPEPPRAPSPVLVSKRLAEEAVAKRNSRLSQLSVENAMTAQAQVSPPAAKTANGGVKGPPKAGHKKRMAPAPPPAVRAGSEVSTYSSSSGSTTVSPGIPTAESTPSPKIMKNPLRVDASSNLVASQDVSTSNLTLVSSTSNASLTSSVKKRKAPTVPPPALSEHSEVPSLTSIIQPSSRPSTPVSRTADGDSESTISHASTPSDVAVSPIPPPAATSTPSPSVEPVIDEDEVVVRKPEVTAPKPAARSRVSQNPPKDHPSDKSEEILVKTTIPQDKRDDEEMEVDLDMFTRRSDTQEIISQQLQLQEKQKAEAERKRLEEEQKQQARESERKKKEKLLAMERAQLETIEQKQAVREEVELPEQPSRRRQWGLPAEMVLNMDKTLTPENSTPILKVRTSSAISPTSSGSEFFSLSEDEADRDTPEFEAEDADAAFAAMCAALALRKTQQGPALPEPNEEEDSAFWHRSSSDRDLTSPQRLTLSSSQSPAPNQAARRSNSFEAGQHRNSKKGSDSPAVDPLHFPSLSSTLLSNYQHLRGEYEDISLSLTEDRDQNDRSGAGPPIPRRRQRSELGVSITSNGSSKSVDMVEIAATATPPPSSEDDDYEDLDHGSKKMTKPVPVPREKASVAEEVVAVEPIYTMVVKSPRIVQAFEQELTDPTVNGVVHSGAEREAGDGQQAGESPVPWEYKLPAPPTPFQDSMPVAPPAESIVTATESSSRPTSSMSVDSLQENLETETPVPETGVMLQSGADLLGESVTEEMLSPTKKNQAIFVLSSDPRDQQYGLESTTDELHSQSAPSSMPPLPTSSPPPESDEDDHVHPANVSLDSDMRFSITTYNRRVAKDSTYDKKLSRSDSSDLETLTEPEQVVDGRHPVEVDAPSAFGDTKEPEVTAVHAKAQDSELSGNEIPIRTTSPPPPAATPAVQPAPAILPADLIQQFQNVLAQHTIAEPQARALQEEFLRLQQQLLTLQLQVAQQQSAKASPETTVTEEPSSIEQVNEQPSSIVVVDEIKEPVMKSIDSPISLTETLEAPADFSSEDRSEPSSIPYEPVVESVVHRYRGPPQVKMDTWKPGRPRSEVIDFSRSSSFNVPFAKKESKSKDVPDFGGRPPLTTQDAVTEVEEKVIVAAEQLVDTQKKEDVVRPKEVVLPEENEKATVPPVEEPLIEPVIVRQKVDNIEKSNPVAVGEKPVVMRKSSFLTARPFEARPVSMPIKRPNFSPMIQPVPFVSRKIRAPEVRGFASLPPVDTDTPSSPPPVASPTSAKPPLAPTSSINNSKPRLVTQLSKDSATVTIRNKLIQSARRPSAELDGSPLNITDPSDLATATKEFTTDEPPPRAPRPVTMPVSSSLLLAAASVNKQESSTAPVPPPPALPLSPQAEKDGPTRRSLSSKFVRRVDPREELLNSIRDFANGGTLKKTGARPE